MQVLWACYFLSGLISLGYQVVWFRHFVERFGSSGTTFALVVCNFIGGLGVGALASRPVASWLRRFFRLSDDLRTYGLIELFITLAALLVYAEALAPLAAGSFPYTLRDGVYYPTWTWHVLRLIVAMGVVFVPCFFMGMTFPLLCHAFRERETFPSALYAFNTLGACCGVLASEFVFLRYIGVHDTLALLVALNAALGAFFLLGGRRLVRNEVPPAAAGVSAGRTGRMSSAPAGDITLSVALFAAVSSGLLCGAIEADIFKRAWFVGATSYEAMSFLSFWAIVAIFAASTLVTWWRRLSLGTIKLMYLAALGYHVLVAVSLFPVRDALNGYFLDASAPSGWLAGHDRLALLLATFLLTGFAMFPSYLFLSTLLPFICNRCQRSGRHLGVVYGANTVAFCGGLVAFSYIVPRVNIFFAMKYFLVLFVILCLAVIVFVRSGRRVGWPGVVLPLLATAAAAWATPRSFDARFFPAWHPASRYPARAVMSNGDHTTFVLDMPGGSVLYFDSHPMASTNTKARIYMALMAHFPLLAQEDPRQALLICFGVGNTLNAITKHASIRRVDVVDLNDRVYATAPEFRPANEGSFADPRVRLICDDGRNYLRYTDEKYDLVTSEPPPPMQAGMYRLYSREYYEDVLAHLTDDGMMTQWLPTYQLAPEATRLAVSTFVQTFPHTLMFVGAGEEMILVGSRRPIRLETIEKRFTADPQVLADLKDRWVPTTLHLLARIIMTDAMLDGAFGHGEVISDELNNFAYLPYSDHNPTRLDWDAAVLAHDLARFELRCGEALVAAATDPLERLRLVPMFPERLLAMMRNADPAAPDVDWHALHRLNRTVLEALDQGDRQRALAAMRRSLEVLPEQPVIMLQAAQVLMELGRLAEAAQMLRRLVRLWPQQQWPPFLLGLCLARQGDVGEAVRQWRHALRLNPRFAEAHHALGDAYAAAGRYEDAINYYEAAVRYRPWDAAVRRRLEEVRAAADHADRPG